MGFNRKNIRASLNKELIKKQGLSEKIIDYVVDLHVKKLEIFMGASKTSDSHKLKRLASELTEIEFLLQAAWGFEQNSNYHRFWHIPKCICPVLDNEDRYPSGIYLYNPSCPIHGEIYLSLVA